MKTSNMVKNAAFTIIQHDTVMLELWLRYYSKWFDHLYVLGIAGGEPEGLEILKKKYPFKFEDLGDIAGKFSESADSFGFAREAIIRVRRKQQDLLKNHSWVLYSNLDEYVVVDPRYWDNLKELMDKEKKLFVYCEGYSILQVEKEKPINYSKPFLKQRKYWSKLPSYNKPLLSRKVLEWAEGCHTLNGEDEIDPITYKDIKNTGLYLLHLNYADLEPLEGRNLGPFIRDTGNRELPDLLQNKELIPYKLRKVF